MNDIVPPAVAPASSALIERVKAILTKPAATWDVIAAETSSPQAVLTSYVVPLAAIPPIAMFIGAAALSIWFAGIGILLPLLINSVVAYVGGLLGVYVLAFVIDALAPSFNGQKNYAQAFKLAAYGCTATWVAGALLIILPIGGLAMLCALFYSIYLMYLGLPKLMKSPGEKSAIYMIAILVVGILVGIVVQLLLRLVLGAGLFGMGAGLMGPMAMHKTPVVANVVVPGYGPVNVDKMEKAANQMAAQASAMQAGQVTVKTADPQALLDLMPGNFMGAARSEPETNSGAAGGMAASGAEATYSVNGGTIHLKVSDIGSMGGMAGMAAAMNVNHTQTTATGYEKVSTDGGKMVSEKYDNQSKSGDYTVMYGNRITVEAEGDNVDMGTLKTLVGQIDAGRAQALVN